MRHTHVPHGGLGSSRDALLQRPGLVSRIEGARIEFLGSAEATDERDAIEKAAQEFKTDLTKLLAAD
jgi:hypothetical protein